MKTIIISLMISVSTFSNVFAQTMCYRYIYSVSQSGEKYDKYANEGEPGCTSPNYRKKLGYYFTFNDNKSTVCTSDKNGKASRSIYGNLIIADFVKSTNEMHIYKFRTDGETIRFSKDFKRMNRNGLPPRTDDVDVFEYYQSKINPDEHLY